MDNLQRRMLGNVAEINRMRSRPMSRQGWLTLLLMLAIAGGAIWGVALLLSCDS